MTKAEKRELLSVEGYASMFGGLEVKRIEYGVEDYVLFVVNAWFCNPSVHRAKIHYGGGANPYFIFKGTRVYFNHLILW